MKPLLNTLYITSPDVYLSKDGLNVVASNSGKELFRIPIHNLQGICTFGYHGASPGLMKLCVDNSVGLSFFSNTGRFIARVQGPVSGNVLLRTIQYETLRNPVECCRLSSLFITGKIFNSRVVLRRFVRDYPSNVNTPAVESAAESLKRLCLAAKNAPDIPTLRGIEGRAAAIYFDTFPILILNPDKCFSFQGRIRRPPTDIVNAMLSLGYSLLATDCANALEGVGLDPAAGFMHALRPGRNSLALDLMEELRAYLVDRFVLSMINNRQVSASDFQIHTDPDNPNPAPVLLTDDGRKKFIASWQNRKKSIITHPFLNEKVEIGLLPHIQASILARALRGDLDNYPVLLLK